MVSRLVGHSVFNEYKHIACLATAKLASRSVFCLLLSIFAVLFISFRLHQVNVNCDRLRQLSITSDAIHCIEYCCNKLRYVLDDASEEINSESTCTINMQWLLVSVCKHHTSLSDGVYSIFSCFIDNQTISQLYCNA